MAPNTSTPDAWATTMELNRNVVSRAAAAATRSSVRLSVQGVQIRVDYGGVVFRLRHGLQGGLQFPLQLGGRHGIQPLG